MSVSSRWHESLVNRAVVLVILVIVVSASFVAIVGSVLSYEEMARQSRAQMQTLAELIAEDLDEGLARRRNILNHTAQSLSMEAQVLQERAGVLVRRQVALAYLFDTFSLYAENGQLLATYPGQRESRQARNIGERDYFRRTREQLTPIISEPFLTTAESVPVVVMTAPVFDHRQKLIGILAGAIRLDKNDFMKAIADVRIGNSGYLSLATRSGMTLVHGGTEAAMEPLPPGNKALAAATRGFEGTVSSRNSEGVSTIMSVRQLSQVPWFVAAVWPSKEAYAPAARLGETFTWVLLAVVLLVAPVTLWVFHRMMRPLNTLGQQIIERHEGIRTSHVDELGGVEIRRVAQTFNRVMEERDQVLLSLAEREAFFRSLTRSAPIGIVQTDVEGNVEFANPVFEQLTGLSSEELQGMALASGVHEDDRHQVTEEWVSVLQRKEVFRGRCRLTVRRNGMPVWVDIMTAVIETPDRVLGTISVVRDITHELQVEADLKTEQQRADTILAVLREGVLMVDTRGQIRYANEAACPYLGRRADCRECNFFDQITVEEEDREWSAREFLRRESVDSLHAVIRNDQGQCFDVELTMLRIRKGSRNERLVFVLRDDTERKRHEERLSWEATHDALTGVLNRRAFSASMVKVLGDSAGEAAASVLMLIDLDHFKPVNDRGGHLTGDEMLRRIADLLRESVRQSDRVARLGGDEFAVILPGCGIDRAAAIAEQIRAGIAAIGVSSEGVTYRVTASIGLTEMSPADGSPREVMARADEGCYIAKDKGRNRVIVVPVPQP